MTPKKTKFVCVAGEQESGKTFLSNLLADDMREAHGMHVVVDAIAAPIYDIARIFTCDPDFDWRDQVAQRRAKSRTYKIFGITPKVSIPPELNTAEVIGRNEMVAVISHVPQHSGFVTGRVLLQDIGRAFRQIYGESFWIEQLAARHEGRCDVAIVSDCRMPSEARMADCLVWIQAKQQARQQNPSDETEKHLGLMRKQSNFQVERDGSRYSFGDVASVRDIESVDVLSDLVMRHLNGAKT